MQVKQDNLQSTCLTEVFKYFSLNLTIRKEWLLEIRHSTHGSKIFVPQKYVACTFFFKMFQFVPYVTDALPHHVHCLLFYCQNAPACSTVPKDFFINSVSLINKNIFIPARAIIKVNSSVQENLMFVAQQSILLQTCC